MYCLTAAAAARVFLRMLRSLAAIRIGKDPDLLESAGCLES
jgi:hypothetical protein